MLKTLTAEDTRQQLICLIVKFQADLKKETGPQKATISNVSFNEIFRVYGFLQGMNRTLYMPGEIGNENVTVVLHCADDCEIYIESVPAIDYRWKVHQQTIELN